MKESITYILWMISCLIMSPIYGLIALFKRDWYYFEESIDELFNRIESFIGY